MYGSLGKTARRGFEEGANMAKKKKRLTRKQLLKEPDEFLTFSAKMIQFATENQRRICYALIGLVVVMLVLGAFRYFSNLSERKAYALFEEGLVHYLGQVSGGKSAHFDEAAKAKFAELLRNYPSTKAAQLSLPLYADMNYKEGLYDEAIELYRGALEAFSEEAGFQQLMWNGLAYAYEGKGDYRSAAQCFQKLTHSESGFMKAGAYFNLGRIYEALNNREKAMEAYNTVVTEFPGSVHGKIAEEKVLGLKG